MRQRMPRVHDGAHLEFIRQLPCVSCGDDTSTEASHLRSNNLTYGKRYTGMAEKPDDRWTLPLCSKCHRTQHTMKEEHFWRNLRIDPFILALSLHAASGDHELAQHVIREQVRR